MSTGHSVLEDYMIFVFRGWCKLYNAALAAAVVVEQEVMPEQNSRLWWRSILNTYLVHSSSMMVPLCNTFSIKHAWRARTFLGEKAASKQPIYSRLTFRSAVSKFYPPWRDYTHPSEILISVRIANCE